MLRLSIYILAGIGLMTIVTHPLTRQGVTTMAEIWDSTAPSLAKAANMARVAAEGEGPAAALANKDNAAVEAEEENVTYIEPGIDIAVKEVTSLGWDSESEAGAESGEALEIYKKAEVDASYNE